MLNLISLRYVSLVHIGIHLILIQISQLCTIKNKQNKKPPIILELLHVFLGRLKCNFHYATTQKGN